MSDSVTVIVNPSAGGGRAERELPRVEAALARLGRPFSVHRTTSIEHARELARGAVDNGDVAAPMGGDGIVGAVAGVVRGSDAELLVLPGGRGNDFARKLGIGKDPAAAVGLLETGSVRRVDVAEAGGAAYLGIASAGIDSDVQDIANATRLPLGGQVYPYATVRALLRWKPARWKVTVDGAAREFSGYSVAVCNSGVFGGGMYLVPDADLGDGMLDVVLMHDSPKLRYLRGLPKVFKGTHMDDPAFELVQAREISFEADRPYRVYADGDPIASLPVTIRVRPGALRVYAP